MSGERATDRRLPDDFLLGTATAGLQIEGGDGESSWHRWADAGRIKDGSHPRRANDHWARVPEDIALLTELGVQTHRLGVEWWRVEPAEGAVDSDALEHYRREIEQLRAAGIEPLVTLHHFTNPLWVEDDGGWLDPRIVERFVRYVRTVVGAIGDLVTDWITINEPNVYLLEGYVFGEWPPGEHSIVAFLRGSQRMVAAHRAAYDAIHEIAGQHGRTARVGVAHHVRVFDPAGPAARPVAAMIDRLVQGRFLDRMTGRSGRWSDFLGLNYYTRDVVHVAWAPAALFSRRTVAAGAHVNDLGWEIYPEGLSRLVRRYAARYRLPIWITENGTCDARDAFRAAFLIDHLSEIASLRASGIAVDRYYHWTLMDNFEWVEGERPRFGLVACEYESQRREIRPSGRLFERIARTRTLP